MVMTFSILLILYFLLLQALKIQEDSLGGLISAHPTAVTKLLCRERHGIWGVAGKIQ